MIRELLNGALGALATIAVIYAFGAFGLLYERLFGASEASTAVAIIGLIVAILIGVAVLHHLSRRTDSSKTPIHHDSASTAARAGANATMNISSGISGNESVNRLAP